MSSSERKGRQASLQIAEQLSSKINSGVYQSRLPSLEALAAEYLVSRSSVVSALKRLKHQGLIESRQGAGTFVTGTMETMRASTTEGIDLSREDVARLTNERFRFSRGQLAALELYVGTQARVAQLNFRDHPNMVTSAAHQEALGKLRALCQWTSGQGNDPLEGIPAVQIRTMLASEIAALQSASSIGAALTSFKRL